jgi:uracil-DNA glycosylase
MPIDDCKGCPSALTNTGFAMGEGPTTAPIMFIGEALGEQEVNEGRPFVGGTGKMLRMMIHQAGIPESMCYITNTVKCRPPGNRTPNQTEIDNCTTRYLNKELDYVKPRVIVPVGDVALRSIIPSTRTGIVAARGYTFQSSRAPVIPIVHPSYVARGNPHFWAITVADLGKIKDAGYGISRPHPEEKFIIRPTIDQVEEAIHTIKSDRLRFTFDLETVGERETLNIMCIGFAWSPSHAICIPLLTRGGHVYWKSPSQEEYVWHLMCDLFDSDIDCVGQNVFTFDIPKLMELGVKFRRTNSFGNSRVHDTLIRHHNIATELPHSLAFLGSIYTDIPHYKLMVKGAGGMMWAPDEIMWTYNLRDCVTTYIADQQISKEMVEMGLA